MTDATAANVLLVDDEADFSQTLAKRLRRRGFQVVVAGNGHDGLAALDRAPADVVLLDVRMPGLDGIETLREMKKRHPPANKGKWQRIAHDTPIEGKKPDCEEQNQQDAQNERDLDQRRQNRI